MKPFSCFSFVYPDASNVRFSLSVIRMCLHRLQDFGGVRQRLASLGVFVGPCGSTDQNIQNIFSVDQFSESVLSCFLFCVYDSTTGGIEHFARMIFLHGYVILFHCVGQNDKNPLWVEPSKCILFYLFIYLTPDEKNVSVFLDLFSFWWSVSKFLFFFL